MQLDLSPSTSAQRASVSDSLGKLSENGSDLTSNDWADVLLALDFDVPLVR